MDPFDLRLSNSFKKAVGKVATPQVVDEIVIDSRRVSSSNSLFISLPGRFHDGHQFVQHAASKGAKYALVKKGFECNAPLTLIHVEDPLAAFQEIVADYRASLATKVVAIGGSIGKTLIKDLLYMLISKKWRTVASPESFNSQIGVPLSLLTIRKNDEVALIEAAVSLPQEMDALTAMIQPDYSVLTLITDRYIEQMGSMANYEMELHKLIASTKKEGWVLVPRELSIQTQLPTYFWNEQCKRLPFASYVDKALNQKMLYQLHFPKEERFVGEISQGFSYFLNLVNIAVKAAYLLDVPRDMIVERLKDYTVELMRTEIWRSPVGTTFINHPYCSDPQSVDSALHHLLEAPPHHRKIFAFGGIRGSKAQVESDLQRIGHAISTSKVDQLLLFGKDNFSPLEDVVAKENEAIDILRFPSYDTLTTHMQATLRHDDTVLIKGKQKESLNSLTERFQDSISHNQCIIDLSAIGSNIASIRSLLPKNNRLMVMVKAQGYGTDDVQLAKYLEKCGVDILGVSYVDEAIGLKRAGVRQNLFVLNAAPYELLKVVNWQLEVGVSNSSFIESLAKQADLLGKRVKVHLHVDTGMSRFGCRIEEALKLAEQIHKEPSLIFEGIMTHLVSSENREEDDFTFEQFHQFRKIIAKLKTKGIEPPWIHIQNSSGAIRFSFEEANMVRLGLGVFGIASSLEVKEKLPLKLAISLVSRIVGLNLCKKGESIGYGRSYIVTKDQALIAVLPIGYFDGLHRHFSSKGMVTIRGKKAPIVGKICMDYMMVDVTDIEGVMLGDTALFFGRDEYGNFTDLEEFASLGGSIVHELLTCLGPRLQRIFVQD